MATKWGKIRCSHRVIVSLEKIIWTGNYLVEPHNLAPHQTYRDVPVKEGDQEIVQCKVRLVEGDSQRQITWDFTGNFNASTSGEIIETSQDGVNYAVDTITVNIVDAAAIDEKSIWCEYGNWPNTIANTELSFKTFVPGGSDFPLDLCQSCKGTEYFKLSKATNRTTKGESLSFNMKQMIGNKVINKYGATSFVTDSSGNICGCK